MYLGWRLAYRVRAVIGLTVMFVRRTVPESLCWLFIHGREDEAEAIVGRVEDEVEAETGQALPGVVMAGPDGVQITASGTNVVVTTQPPATGP